MKKYNVILTIPETPENLKNKTYSLIIESETPSTLESTALSQTGNTGATNYDINIIDLGTVPPNNEEV